MVADLRQVRWCPVIHFFKEQACTCVDIETGSWRRCSLTERKVGNRVKSRNAGINLFSWLIFPSICCVLYGKLVLFTFLRKLLIIQGTKVTWDIVGKVFKRLKKFEHAAIWKPFSDESDGKTFLLLQHLLAAGFHHILGQQEAFEAFRLLHRGHLCPCKANAWRWEGWWGGGSL